MDFQNPAHTENKMSPFTSQSMEDRNIGIDCHGCQKRFWKIKERSSRTGTIIQTLRDAAKDMWDRGHCLLYIGHILLG